MKVGFPLMSLRHHGGVRVIVDYANHLVERGHAVHIFVPKNQFLPLYPLDERIRVHLLRNSNEVDLFSRLKTLYDLAKAMQRVEMDVVVANFFPTAYPAYFLRNGTRVVYFVQDTPHLFSKLSPMGLAMHLSHRLPFPKVTTSTFIRRGAGFQAEVISPGVSPSFYPEPDPGLLEEKQHPALLYFPRRQAYKGMEYFVAAVRELAQKGLRFEVWLVTAEEEALNPFDDMNIPSLIVDGGDDARLRKLYSSADVFVSSSITEGFNLPPLEAMACGTPVVMTHCGGSGDYAEDGVNALVVPPRDASGLASAVERVLSDRGLAQRLREGGFQTAQRFSARRSAERFEKFLRSIVSSG